MNVLQGQFIIAINTLIFKYINGRANIDKNQCQQLMTTELSCDRRLETLTGERYER